jgi:hypothetical protein
MMRAAIRMACLLALAGSHALHADEPTQPATGFGERLDHLHDRLFERMQSLLRGFDTGLSKSGEAPLLVPVSPIRIGFDATTLHADRGLTTVASPDFEANVRLPNIERRLTLFISSADLPESSLSATGERNPVRAGIRLPLPEHVTFDIGVRIKLRPVAFAALRWMRTYEMGSVRVQPFVKPYVESGLGVGASGGLSVEHWHERWLLRLASYANWSRDNAATDWSQTLVFGHARAMIQEGRNDRLSSGHDLGCGVLLVATASGSRLARASAYEAGLVFKRPLRGGWLFAYAEPLVRWEHDSGWHPDAGIRVGLDALFWGLSSLPAAVAGQCRQGS